MFLALGPAVPKNGTDYIPVTILSNISKIY